jgi:hypothetical protein
MQLSARALAVSLATRSVPCPCSQNDLVLACVCGAQEPLLGVFPFSSAKQSHSTNQHQGRCLAHMFVMRVAEELEVWPEHPQRSRLWVSRADGGVRVCGRAGAGLPPRSPVHGFSHHARARCA